LKHRLSALLGAAALLAAAMAQAGACTAGADSEACGQRRSPPRIIFGQSEGATFDFGEFRPLRRSAASSRQAYFGSGEAYTATLAGLRDRMRSLRARSALEALPLTPAQQDARTDMAPALMRALTLAKQARDGSEAAD
jgi:hypothetical protein